MAMAPDLTTTTATTIATSASTLTTTLPGLNTPVSYAQSGNNWADIVVNGGHSPQIRDVSDFSTGHSYNHSEAEQPFIEPSTSRSRRRKRQRQQSVQQQQQQQHQHHQQQQQQNEGQPSSQLRQPRRLPLIIGKSTMLQSMCKVAAAKPLLKKSVFYIDNVDTSVSANDLTEFVKSLSVDVLSCFEVKPRKRWSNANDGSASCRAFRLCIPETHQPKLLDPGSWPSYITVSEWFFKSSHTNERNSVLTAASTVVKGLIKANETETPALASAATMSSDVLNNVLNDVNDANDGMDVTVTADASMLNRSLSDTVIYNAAND
jgi:hypothetical protein